MKPFRSRLLLVLLLAGVTAHGQTADTVKSWWYQDTTSWMYKMEKSSEKWGRLGGLPSGGFQLFSRVLDPKEKKKPSRGNIGYYGKGNIYWINDVGEVEFAATGVTPQTGEEYMYHVVANDSVELVPWTSPSSFRSNERITYAYLGRFNIRNRIIRLEFYRKGHYQERNIWVINDLYLPRATLWNMRLTYNNRFLFRPYQQHFVPRSKEHYYQPEDWAHDSVRFQWSDSISHLEVTMVNTVQNDMYNVYLKRVIAGTTDTVYISSNWNMSYYSPNPFVVINSSYFNKPGRYEIMVLPQVPEEFGVNTWSKAVSIPFTVDPSPNRVFSKLQLIIWISVVLVFCGLLLLVYHLISRRRLAGEARQKEMASLRLQSVRAQLNPHFMFNALAGIQNLMNKNDINGANLYLSKFAHLTRKVLDDSRKETLEIAEECQLLNTYLQMEQMRFGFAYDIFVDEKIDQENTFIPSMLIQPYVENAVRHGVSVLKEKGRITVSFLQEDQAIRVEVYDNGKGYPDSGSKAGNGTRLSEERVDLLNRLHRNGNISVARRSDNTGTLISLILTGYTYALDHH